MSLHHLGHLKRLTPYLRRHARPFVWCLGGMFVARMLEATVPLFLKFAIDGLADESIEPNLLLWGLAVIGVTTVRFVVLVFARRVNRRIAISVCYDVRKRLFNHIQLQGPSFFNMFSTGDLMSRSINDLQMIRHLFAWAWVNVATFVFSIAAGLYFMIVMSPMLTLWVTLPLPLVAIAGFWMARAMFPYYRERQIALSSITSFTQENLNGIRTIQAMAHEDHEIGRFKDLSSHYAYMVYRATRF